MTDDEFLQAFMDRTLSGTQFHHRDHLRLAWLLITRFDREAASVAIADGIRSFAIHHGHSQKYHETMTQFWVRIVAHAMMAHPEIESFERFLEAFPLLLDGKLPFRHWSHETMMTLAARSYWVEPDLQALPF
jgi:CDP-diacylglycerol--glycerol-3-phosphate 3-phosphatidyltransferase